MFASIFDNPINGIKKRIVIFQPSLCFSQVRIYVVRRNQAGHGFASFCNEGYAFCQKPLDLTALKNAF
jgi:hypothetical protein